MDEMKRARRPRIQFRTVADIEKRLLSRHRRPDGLVSALGDALRSITVRSEFDAPTFRTRRAAGRTVRRLLKMDDASVATLLALWERICHRRPTGEGLAELASAGATAVDSELAYFITEFALVQCDEYEPFVPTATNPRAETGSGGSPRVVPHPLTTLRADLRWLASKFKRPDRSGPRRKSWPSALHHLSVRLEHDPRVSEDLRSKPRLAVARWASGKAPHLPPIPSILGMMRRANRS